MTFGVDEVINASSYPIAAKAISSRASKGNSVLRLVLNTAVMVSVKMEWSSLMTVKTEHKKLAVTLK